MVLINIIVLPGYVIHGTVIVYDVNIVIGIFNITIITNFTHEPILSTYLIL